jgi:hypothetical protein
MKVPAESPFMEGEKAPGENPCLSLLEKLVPGLPWSEAASLWPSFGLLPLSPQCGNFIGLSLLHSQFFPLSPHPLTSWVKNLAPSIIFTFSFVCLTFSGWSFPLAYKYALLSKYIFKIKFLSNTTIPPHFHSKEGPNSPSLLTHFSVDLCFNAFRSY